MDDNSTDSRTAAFSRKRAAGDDDATDNVPAKRPRSPGNTASFNGWNQGVKSNIRPSLGRPRLSSRPNVPTAADKIEAAGHTVKRSASPSAQLGLPQLPPDGVKSHASLEPVYDPAPPPAGESSSEDGEIQSAFSGDDEAVVINVAHGTDLISAGNQSEGGGESLESGEITDDQQPPTAGFDGAADSETQDMDVSDDTQSEYEWDPKSGTAKHEVEVVEHHADGSVTKNRPDSSDIPPPPVTLADLDFDELQKQLRYYHIGQDPAQIPLTELARCLSCATIGHISAGCPELACRHCGARERHFISDCPQIVTCNKCQQRGHGSQSCPLKLKPTDEELHCDLCGCSHHGPSDCETLWRTSLFPPASALGPTIKLYCYECGLAGHLGNDCAQRRPGKGVGTSMWSKKTMPGGVVPASSRHHDRGPIPLSKTQLKKLERQRPAPDDSVMPTTKSHRSKKPKNAPSIKIAGDVAKGRQDLQGGGPGPAPSARPQQPPGVGGSGGAAPKDQHTADRARHKAKVKAKAKAKKKNNAARPMPSAAKKAYQKGKS